MKPFTHTFIYALCDPDTEEIRYIGKSDKPHRGLYGHIADNREKFLMNRNKK